MAAGGLELTTRPVRNAERRLRLPAPSLQVLNCSVEIGNSIDEDRPLALEMSGKQKVRRLRAEPHHRDARSERLDREHELGSQHLDEVLDVCGNVATGHVQKVETFEGWVHL